MGFTSRSSVVLAACVISLSSFAAIEKKSSAPVVSILKAEKKELFDRLTYPAQVHSLVEASVLADNGGVVTQIYAPLGQTVKKGQRILKITHTDPIYNYAPLVVRSPVNGVVSAVDVTEGSRVAKGQKIAIVTDPKKVCIKVEVAAVDLPLVTKNLEGEFTLPGVKETIKVKVSGVSPLVDPATGTATGQLELVDPNASLTPGRVGRVDFKANLHKGFMLPDHALVFRQTKTLIRVVKDGKAKMVTVRLGKKSRGQVEILEGLEEGLDIIERASKFVAEGDKVTIQVAEKPKPKTKAKKSL